MFHFALRTAALLLGLVLAKTAVPDEVAVRSIHGWVERVEIWPENISLKAKMDTGATTSSLNALNKAYFERDGERWIAFDIIDPEDAETTVRIERPVSRYVRIVRHDGTLQRRPVVRITLCMGGYLREEEINLIDRTQLNYQVLVGRNHMRGIILVDPAETFLQPPRCSPAEGTPDEHRADADGPPGLEAPPEPGP